MMTIGHFRRDGDGFTGKLDTFASDALITLTPAEKFSAKAPDFIAWSGQRECGAGWRVNDTSGAVLSLKIDDPTWPEPVSGRIMASEDGVLPLVWYRRAEAPLEKAPPG